MTVPPTDDRPDDGADGYDGTDGATAAAVARIRADLAALPPLPMPPDVADRILAELTSTPVGLRRRKRMAPLLLGAAALLGSVVVTASTLAAPPPDVRPAGVDDDLRAAGAAAFGRDGAGALADPVRRRSCLTSVGAADPDAALIGGTPHGAGATLLVLGTDVAGRYRLLVVDDGCRRIVAESRIGP